ncbi:ABC transporter ATP-binding protein [Mycoplasmatota bacterium]|nr:ABC transporter ATP-binding protein [Mycoplasmatota bacterium]
MLLVTRNLEKIYGGKNDISATHALKDMNLKIQKGEFVGIMGPSGSGKTTLLNMLGGLDEPTSGQVELMNYDLSKMNQNELALFRRKHIGFIFQDFNLLDSLTVKENIMLPMILDHKEESLMKEKANELIQYLSIQALENKYPYQISGGQKQKTSIARALINEPSILLADEPTGNLDSKSSISIMQSLEKLNQEKESTILLVTHDALAASFCKRIIFIKDGKIHLEMVRKGNRKAFFDQILDNLAVLGGEPNEF